jgi:hypothetical protein
LAEGRLADLDSDVRVTPTFLDFDKEDLQEFLTEMHFSAKKTREVFEAFDVSRERAVEAYEEHQPTIQLFRARKRVDAALNYFLMNELYLSPEVARQGQTILRTMRDLLYRSMADATGPPVEHRELMRRISKNSGN